MIYVLQDPMRMVDIALGGGREMFLPQLAQGDELHNGSRADGVDLIQRFRDGGGNYAWSKDCVAPNEDPHADLTDCMTLAAAIADATRDPANPKPVLGLFEPSHMMYDYDRVTTSEDEPSLRNLAKQAIDYLEATSGDDGYFLMVEGGRVDHANHGGNIYRTITDAMAYQEAVDYAMKQSVHSTISNATSFDWALSVNVIVASLNVIACDRSTSDEDTLIISTADHSHGLEFQAYCGRGSPVNGLCYDLDGDGEAHSPDPLLADDQQPFTTMGFMNGAGSLLKVGGSNELIAGKRRVVTNDMAMSANYQQEAILPKGSESHSGTDVGIYARGPWAHLVDGTIEQNAIFHIMAYAVADGHCAPYK